MRSNECCFKQRHAFRVEQVQKAPRSDQQRVAKRSINLSPIIAKIDEQVSIVEQASSAAPMPLLQIPRRKVKPTKSWIHRAVEKIEKNPYYRLAVIVAIILGLIALFFRFP